MNDVITYRQLKWETFKLSVHQFLKSAFSLCEICASCADQHRVSLVRVPVKKKDKKFTLHLFISDHFF